MNNITIPALSVEEISTAFLRFEKHCRDNFHPSMPAVERESRWLGWLACLEDMKQLEALQAL